MTIMKREPQLRFPGFENEWAITKLHNISDVLSGKRIPKGLSLINEDTGVPYITISDMGEKYINEESLKYITPEIEQKILKYKVKTNDIIISVAGTLGKINLIQESMNGANLTENCNKITNLKNVDLGYLYTFLTTRLVANQISSANTISSQPKLALERVRNLKISTPSLPEQQKIADCLTAMDESIESQQQKVEQLKAYKKGLLQQILSQSLRFPGFEGEWEEKKLGEVCEITTGKLDANAMTEDGEYHFFTCAKEAFKIDKYAFDTEALLVSGNGANVGYIHYFDGKFNAYQRTYVLDNFGENIFYLKFFLEKYLPRRILREKNEGATPYIVLNTLYGMHIKCPDNIEQEKIADCLSTLDEVIDLESQKLEQLRQYKKGLLQQLFV